MKNSSRAKISIVNRIYMVNFQIFHGNPLLKLLYIMKDNRLQRLTMTANLKSIKF